MSETLVLTELLSSSVLAADSPLGESAVSFEAFLDAMRSESDLMPTEDPISALTATLLNPSSSKPKAVPTVTLRGDQFADDATANRVSDFAAFRSRASTGTEHAIAADEAPSDRSLDPVVALLRSKARPPASLAAHVLPDPSADRRLRGIVSSPRPATLLNALAGTLDAEHASAIKPEVGSQPPLGQLARPATELPPATLPSPPQQQRTPEGIDTASELDVIDVIETLDHDPLKDVEPPRPAKLAVIPQASPHPTMGQPGAESSARVDSAMTAVLPRVGAAETTAQTNPAISEAPMNLEADAAEVPDQLIAHVKTMIRRGVRTARIEAHPRELGSVEIALRMERSGVEIEALASTSELRDLLSENAPRLRALLDESNVDLADLNIGQHESDDASAERDAETDADGERADAKASDTDVVEGERNVAISTRLLDVFA